MKKRFTLLTVAMLSATPVVRGEEPSKVFELSDGTAVIGVVINETDTSYLIRSSDGTTRRILYTDLAKVHLIAVPSPPQPETTPPPPAPAHLSDDGYAFPSEHELVKYKKKRIVFEVIDTTSDTVISTEVTRGSSSGVDIGKLASIAAGQMGAPQMDLGLTVGGTKQKKVKSNTVVETVNRGYRLTTGEGIVLTNFFCAEFRYEPLIPGAPKNPELLNRYAKELNIPAVVLSSTNGGWVKSNRVTADECTHQDTGKKSWYVYQATTPKDFFHHIQKSRVFEDSNTLIYRSKRKRESKDTRGGNMFVYPWTPKSMLRWVNSYNDKVAKMLGGS